MSHDLLNVEDDIPLPGRRPLTLHDPTTEEAFAEVMAVDARDVDRAVRAALPGWEATGPAARSALLNRL